MKVALVHDHLVQDGGAEKVLQVLQDVFPDAPTFTLLYDAERVDPAFRRREIRTSFLQKIPFGLKKYQWLLPFMPAATESYDLSEYDVVLSSSSAFAKGVLTKPDAVSICYCHTPTRYLWSDTHSYVQELRVPGAIKWFLPMVLNKLRLWDRVSAERVDRFVANSTTVARRIRKYYQRDSDVIYPPVETSLFSVAKGASDYFLAGGRLVSYKRFDLLVDVFNELGLKLKIFGEGPMRASLQAAAKPNVEFVGKVDDAAKADLYRHAIAFLHPQEEDFGITAVESMASGRPVIAYRRGGACETVIEGVTGVFFDAQDREALKRAVASFDASRFDPAKIRSRALAFDTEIFKKRIKAYVEAARGLESSAAPAVQEASKREAVAV